MSEKFSSGTINPKQTNKLSLSDLCLRVEKKILKEYMHFHYKTYMATP